MCVCEINHARYCLWHDHEQCVTDVEINERHTRQTDTSYVGDVEGKNNRLLYIQIINHGRVKCNIPLARVCVCSGVLSGRICRYGTERTA